MRPIFKSPEAENDLEAIWLYSFNQWNEAQADRYYDELINGIEKLATYPKLGKPCDTIRSGYRSIHINHHVIYYRLQGDIIDIVRVLHERMVPEKHL